MDARMNAKLVVERDDSPEEAALKIAQVEALVNGPAYVDGVYQVHKQNARRGLIMTGLYPLGGGLAEWGVEAERATETQAIVNDLPNLDPRDLYAVELLVHALACADGQRKGILTHEPTDQEREFADLFGRLAPEGQARILSLLSAEASTGQPASEGGQATA